MTYKVIGNSAEDENAHKKPTGLIIKEKRDQEQVSASQLRSFIEQCKEKINNPKKDPEIGQLIGPFDMSAKNPELGKVK